MAVASQRFVRRNRKGRVLTVAREHYLRGAHPRTSAQVLATAENHICVCSPADDLPVLDPATASRPRSGRWLVLDTNVVLHQMDVLEHGAISHCIVLQTGSNATHRVPTKQAVNMGGA